MANPNKEIEDRPLDPVEHGEHTPGPWRALPWERENGGKDWNVWGPKPTNHLDNPDLQGDFGRPADARLIAASPDLLEAWRDFLEAWGDGELDDPMKVLPYIDKARKAVAKAEGRQA